MDKSGENSRRFEISNFSKVEIYIVSISVSVPIVGRTRRLFTVGPFNLYEY